MRPPLAPPRGQPRRAGAMRVEAPWARCAAARNRHPVRRVARAVVEQRDGGRGEGMHGCRKTHVHTRARAAGVVRAPSAPPACGRVFCARTTGRACLQGAGDYQAN
eukprot:5517595-Prymnesium_polylepis.1